MKNNEIKIEMPENSLNKLRIDVAVRGKWNIGFFSAGFALWIFFGIICNTLPLEKACIYMVVGTLFVFPMAVLFSKVFNADPFTKEIALEN